MSGVVDFGERTLPYGVFAHPDGPRVCVAFGELLIDLVERLGDTEFRSSSLNAFMACGPEKWADVRSRVLELVAGGVTIGDPGVHRQADCVLQLPVDVADFVDFFSGIEHATNAGKILRPDEEALKPNYRHLPVGYHGRAGTVIASGEPIFRPSGQLRQGDTVREGPSQRLDVEVEVGYVVGVSSDRGMPTTAEAFHDHVFGAVVLIDWSARDIQAWEYQPLGPFLGKSFATTISSWVVPLSALGDAWVDGPSQEPSVLAYLAVDEPRNPALAFELSINGQVISRPDSGGLYWSPAQQMAHMTRNGASLRTGDIYGTGTVSSFEPSGQGSLMELSWGGSRPFVLEDGTERTFLEDGDDVSLRALIGGDPARPFGEATGTVVARPDY